MAPVSVFRLERGLMSAGNVRLPRRGGRNVHIVRPGRQWLKIDRCARSDGRHHLTASNGRTTDFCRAHGGSRTAPLMPWTGCSGKTGTERSHDASHASPHLQDGRGPLWKRAHTMKREPRLACPTWTLRSCTAAPGTAMK